MFSLYYDPRKKHIEERRENDPDCGDDGILVEVCAVNICGSDMHYFSHGRCGSYIIKSPLILGHEGSGRIAETCSGTAPGLVKGGRVFLNPYHFCGECAECLDGRENFCRNGKFMGTASVIPHNHGFLRQYVCLPAEQCLPAPDHIPYEQLACAEPLSVVLHAAKRAGNIEGKRIAVTGAGAIGLLMIMVARLQGAERIAAVDIENFARNNALEMGADEAGDGALLAGGGYDVIFETTGAPEILHGSLSAVKAGGTIVQIGTLARNLDFHGQDIVSREINLLGSFRYTTEFKDAVSLIGTGRVDLSSYVTHIFSRTEANDAFHQALNKKESLKVSIRVDR